MMFVTISMIGQLVFSLGFSASSIYLMIIGRFIMGLGGESILIACTSLLSDYFMKPENLSLFIVSFKTY